MLQTLQLARNSARQQEFAVRATIGAGRSRLIQQLLTEGIILAFMEAAVGLLLAGGSVHLLRIFASENVIRLGDFSFDRSVLAFTLVATCVIAILFGLLPAFAASQPDLQETLTSTGLRTAGARAGWRLRVLLASAELALALVQLVGSGLLLRSFILVSDVDPRFRSLPCSDRSSPIAGSEILKLRAAMEVL